MEKAYLIMSDGSVYEGARLGAKSSSVIGEIVFEPSMAGYMQTLGNAAHAGKLAVQTFPIIGTYGAINLEAGGAPVLSGYIVREACANPSNVRMQSTLCEYLSAHCTAGISGVDTRSIRRKGRGAVLYGMIAPDKSNLDAKVKLLREAAKAASKKK